MINEKVITKEKLSEYMLKIQKLEDEGLISYAEFRGYCCQLEVLFTDMYDECAHELNLEAESRKEAYNE